MLAYTGPTLNKWVKAGYLERFATVDNIFSGLLTFLRPRGQNDQLGNIISDIFESEFAKPPLPEDTKSSIRVYQMIQAAIEKYEAGRDNDKVRQSSILGASSTELVVSTAHGARKVDKRKRETSVVSEGSPGKMQRVPSMKQWTLQDQSVFDKGGWNQVPESIIYDQEIQHKNRLFVVKDDNKCKYTATKEKCQKCVQGGAELHVPVCVYARCNICRMVGHYSWSCHQKPLVEGPLLSPKKEGVKPKKAAA
jgi:hypothetical protein